MNHESFVLQLVGLLGPVYSTILIGLLVVSVSAVFLALAWRIKHYGLSIGKWVKIGTKG